MISIFRKFIGNIIRRAGINPSAALLSALGVVSFNRQTNTYLRTVLGHTMHLHPNDPGLSQALIKTGVREPESVLSLMRYLTPDMTIMDLGANIGFYVLLEAYVITKGQGRIVALEPFPENLRLLKLNTEANNYTEKVKIINGACSDSTGTAEFTVSKLSNCGKLAEQTSPTTGKTIKVPTFTFKDLMQFAGLKATDLDFLRMDIEGAEYKILPDILDVIGTKDSFLMFIEFHPGKDRAGHAAILKRMEELGYRSLNIVKEYIENGITRRKHCPSATIRDLYSQDFFMQGGGIETFLLKGKCKSHN